MCLDTMIAFSVMICRVKGIDSTICQQLTVIRFLEQEVLDINSSSKYINSREFL